MPADKKSRYAKSVLGLALLHFKDEEVSGPLSGGRCHATSAPASGRTRPKESDVKATAAPKSIKSPLGASTSPTTIGDTSVESSSTTKTHDVPPPEPTKPQTTKPHRKGGKSPQKLENEVTKGQKVKDTLGTAAGSLRSKINLPNNMEWTYYLGGGNGVAIIDETLSGLGYKKIKEKNDDSYRFKWVELKGQINYHTFREGEQMVNHIPNCHLLTNKLGLVNSLQEYDRMCTNVNRKSLKLDFIPETYKLDDKIEREQFYELFTEGDLWICKPTGRNQGKGIFLVRHVEEVTRVVTDNEEINQHMKASNRPQVQMHRIIQRYIPNPLLLDGRKFDIRAYMLIANTSPYLVLYHKGYVRLCMHDYQTNSESLICHLTNQYIQKKDPKYKDSKEDTVWSMDKFNDYVNKNLATDKDLEQDWVYSTLTNRMKHIMTYCFNAVRHRLQRKVGYSDLYGLDFMVDDEMKVWLIEINVNPSLTTNCEALREVVPAMVKECIYLSIECFEKSRRNRPLMPLQSLQNFSILHNGSPTKATGATRANHRSITATPSSKVLAASGSDEHGNKRSRSLSPLKEVGDNNGATARSRITNRHILKATPTLLNPQATRTELSTSNSRLLKEKTTGAYRHASVKPLSKNTRSNKSPTQARKISTVTANKCKSQTPIETPKTDNEDKEHCKPKSVEIVSEGKLSETKVETAHRGS